MSVLPDNDIPDTAGAEQLWPYFLLTYSYTVPSPITLSNEIGNYYTAMPRSG
jgi:hypothetical protein